MNENASGVFPNLIPLSGTELGLTVNQQGSLLIGDPSETTRRTPPTRGRIMAYKQAALHDGTNSANHRFRISQKGTEWFTTHAGYIRGFFDAEGGIPHHLSARFYIQSDRIMASTQDSYLRAEEDDIVHALWRHRGIHEQGIPSGSWGWITSFLE